MAIQELHEEKPPTAGAARVLVVEDDLTMARMLQSGLEHAGFQVVHVASGEECMACLDEVNPDVMIIDIGLPVMDGLETCRAIREARGGDDLSILFLSGSECLEDRLLAYDAGGDDFIPKPPILGEIYRKVENEVARRLSRLRYAEALQNGAAEVRAAMEGLRESNIGLAFARGALNCRTLTSLAELSTASLSSYGLNCLVQIRAPSTTLTWAPQGLASPLEESVFSQTRDLGRLFQFRRRLIVNYDRFSLLVVNMPIENDELSGRIRDVAAIVAETGNAAVEGIAVYLDALDRTATVSALAAACEQSIVSLQSKMDARYLQVQDELSSLVAAFESMYYRMGLSDIQEKTISGTASDSVARVMRLLESSEEFQLEFSAIQTELKKAAAFAHVEKESTSSSDVDLWF